MSDPTTRCSRQAAPSRTQGSGHRALAPPAPERERLDLRRQPLDEYALRIYTQLVITWDEEKRRANLRKHGFDFVDAGTVFDGVTYTYEDDRLTMPSSGS